ncbi:helix-turn-helix transcriptional regulator [Cupriavidus metallidurans]|uniref:helix-turn-helix transcriptional regulator n=1 Tax=Cupriavidus metallidurans TaxID=119219 RepID=UPI000CE01F02|nr:AlpA family phage regulatory protein [Cupriavidus metallidurans]AVA36301.1 hypothetical protein C3Z06_23605 [Cupriavidus metallidurans]
MPKPNTIYTSCGPVHKKSRRTFTARHAVKPIEGEAPSPEKPPEASRPLALPRDGYSRFRQLQPFLPVSRETWRKLSRDGRAPAPVRLGTRCTVWKNSDVHQWLSDPLNYRA